MLINHFRQDVSTYSRSLHYFDSLHNEFCNIIVCADEEMHTVRTFLETAWVTWGIFGPTHTWTCEKPVPTKQVQVFIGVYTGVTPACTHRHCRKVLVKVMAWQLFIVAMNKYISFHE